MPRSLFLAGLLCLLLSSNASARQEPFQAESPRPLQAETSPPSPSLSGRFLHVTDFHPDPHYKVGSKISSGCHSHKLAKKKKDKAGFWGSPVSGCDSPMRLVEGSLAWIKDNWLPVGKSSDSSSDRSQFDFIIWTGDSARHDLDNKYPRTRKEIYNLNEWCLSLLQHNFPNTPIIPTIGNNDIFPHNIMWPGPNDVTSAYSEIWADVIPEYQLHTFQLGGYFSKEVIPGKLAVISMNTIYWYDSNKVVDGCKGAKKRRAKRGRARAKGAEVDDVYDWTNSTSTPSDTWHTLKSRDPGTIQLEWLESQLEQFRKRNIHVHLIGHVPPTAGNYFDECYDVYTDIVLHNQQTVIGQHFGHMNVDAFFVQEDTEAVKGHERLLGEAAREGDDEEQADEHVTDEDAVTPALSTRSLSEDLRKDYAILPGSGRTNESYYHYFFEAPSIVPTYLPSIRVWTYNVSGVHAQSVSEQEDDFEEMAKRIGALSESGTSIPMPDPISSLRRKHRRPKHGHKKKSSKLPRHVSSHSPVRSNQPLTLLGYSQWILDLDAANEKEQKDATSLSKPKLPTLHFDLEYTTYTPSTLWSNVLSSTTSGPIPVPRHLLQRELSKRNLSTSELDLKHKLPKKLRHLTEYALPHVTVSHVLALARRLAVDDRLWRRFEKRIYQDSTGAEEG